MNMKTLLTVSALLLAGGASAQAAAPALAPAPAAAPAALPAAQPKQIHIVVGEFKCAASGCNGPLLSDALTNALMQSGRFAVYERAALAQGLGEGFIAGADAGSQIQGADVIVLGTVTAYGQDASSGSGCFIGMCFGAKTERAVATLRIFDVKSSRIIGTAQVEGLSNGMSGSLNLAGFSFGGSQNSGMDKAVAAMLQDAVQKLSTTIPAAYFR